MISIYTNHTRNTELESALEVYLQSQEFLQLGIGTVKNVEMLKRFERPYSLHGVFRLQGEAGEQVIYVKIYKNWRVKPVEQFQQEIETEFQTLQFWYDQLVFIPDATTFRPLFCSPKLYCIITEAATGENLATLIQRQACGFPKVRKLETLKSYLFRCARLLQQFQEKTRQNVIYDYQNIIEDVDIRLRQLVRIPFSGFKEIDRVNVLNFYKRHFDVVSRHPVQEVILHRDFGLNNVLVSEKHIIVHDFNRMKCGHPYMDFTRLYHQLEMLAYKPVYRKRVIRQLQDAYFAGYGFTDGRGDVLFRFFLLRHFFTHLLGLVRTSESSVVSRVYSRWVIFRHLRLIQHLISD